MDSNVGKVEMQMMVLPADDLCICSFVMHFGVLNYAPSTTRATTMIEAPIMAMVVEAAACN